MQPGDPSAGGRVWIAAILLPSDGAGIGTLRDEGVGTSSHSQGGGGSYQAVLRQMVKDIVNRYRSPGPGINDLLDACPHSLSVDADHVANEVIWGLCPDPPRSQLPFGEIPPVPGHDELRVHLDGGSEYVAVIGIRKI